MGVTTSAMTWIQRIAARFGQSRDTEQTEAADLIVRINEATTEDERRSHAPRRSPPARLLPHVGGDPHMNEREPVGDPLSGARRRHRRG